MSSTDAPSPTGGAPAVGNILGLGLLLRDRTVVLSLERRGLEPGIRVRDLEAEIRHVPFPLAGALSAARFRHHRSRLLRATLQYDVRVLLPRITERLRGLHLDVVDATVVDVDVELREESRGSTSLEAEIAVEREFEEQHETPAPTIVVELRTRHGGILHLVVPVALVPSGSSVELHPIGASYVGRAQGIELGSAITAWRALVEPLRPVAQVRDGVVSFEPASWTLLRPFASAGWRAPDVTGVDVESITIERRSIHVELRRNAAVPSAAMGGGSTEAGRRTTPAPLARQVATDRRGPSSIPPTSSTLLTALAGVRAALDRGDRATALRQLETITRAVSTRSPLRLALVRWRADLGQLHDRAASIAALREWLELRPRDPVPRRRLVAILAALGEANALAQLLLAERREREDESQRDAIDLGLAALLAGSLGDAGSAMSILVPMTARLRRDPARRSDLEAALVGLAEARAIDALKSRDAAPSGPTPRAGSRLPHVQAALDEACVLVEDAERRMDMRLRIARRLAQYGGDAAALRMIAQALADTRPPRDDGDLERARHSAQPELLELAVEAATRLGQTDVAAEFARHRLLLAGPRDRGAWQRRRIDLLAHSDDAATMHERLGLIEEALRTEPDSIDLLRDAFSLSERLDDAHGALRHGWALLDRLDDERDDVVDVRITMSRILLATRDEHAAWDMLRPLLARDDVTGERLHTTLELALVLAPAFDRARILDRLIDVAQGRQLGRALVERADLAMTPAQRWKDLERALTAGADPHAVLSRMEGSVDADDAPRLGDVAGLARDHGVSTVELRVLVRLGQHLARQQRWDEAVAIYDRARELAPERDDVTVALGEAYVEMGSAREGLALLQRFLDPERAANAGASESVVALRMARAALALGDDAQAADLLARARSGLSSADLAFSTLAEELFDVLYRLGRSEDAGALARDMAAHADGQARASWLLRSAEFERDDARLQALFEAATLAPHDPEILDALEAELRARERWTDLDALFESRLTRTVEPASRIELLERWVSGRSVESIPSENLALVADACEELLALRPADVKLELQLADLLSRSGDFTSAAEHRRRAIAALPLDDVDAARAAFELAVSALSEGDVNQARRLCARARAGGLRDPALLRLECEVARAAGDDDALLATLAGLLEITTPVAHGDGGPTNEGWTLERDLWSGELVDLALAREDLDLAAYWLGARCEGTHLDRRERERRFEAWIDFARRHDRLEDERIALGRRRDLLGEAWSPAEFSREIIRLAGPLDRFEEALSRVTARLLERPDDEELYRLLLEITKEPSRTPRRIATFEVLVRVVHERSQRSGEAADKDGESAANQSEDGAQPMGEALATAAAIRLLIDGLERTSTELDTDAALHCLDLACSLAAPVDRVTLLAEALVRRPSEDRVAATILSTTAELRGEPPTPPWSNAVIGQSFALVDGIARSRGLDEDSRTAARMALVGMLPEETAVEMLVALARGASLGSGERDNYVDALCGRGRWRDVLDLLRVEATRGPSSSAVLSQIRGVADSAERMGDLDTARASWTLLLSALPRDAIEERLQAVRASTRLGVESDTASVLSLAHDLLDVGRQDDAVEVAVPHVRGLALPQDVAEAGSSPAPNAEGSLLQALCEAHLRGAIPRRHVSAVAGALATRAAMDPELAAACERLAGADRDGPLSLVRGWTEALPPGQLRARHAARLLHLGRGANAPRAVAQAIEALQSDADAGVESAIAVVEDPVFVDHRTWLARSLGLVDDEIARLETALLSTANHEMAWRGLMSLREGDLDAAVTGVLDRAEAQAASARSALEPEEASTSTIEDGTHDASPDARALATGGMTEIALDAIQFVRDVVPAGAISPEVRLRVLTAAFALGAAPEGVVSDLDRLVTDVDTTLLPALRHFFARVFPALTQGTAATETAGGPDGDRQRSPAIEWIEALARRVSANLEIDEDGWVELSKGAARLPEDLWTHLVDATALCRPRTEVLELVERRLDEPSLPPTEALVMRYLSLQPTADLVLELPRISAGPSAWFSRHDDAARDALAAATERAVAWIPTAWSVRDVRRVVATARLAAIDQHGDRIAAERARSGLQRVLRSDLDVADQSDDRSRGITLRIALLDANPEDAVVVREILRWFEENDEPAQLRAPLLDALDSVVRSTSVAVDTADLDIARIELLASAGSDPDRVREGLTAFFERHGPTPEDVALGERFLATQRVTDGFAPGTIRAALADALQITTGQRRVALANALLRRSLDEADSTSLRLALDAGANFDDVAQRTRAVKIAAGDAALRASLRWFVLQALAQDDDEDSLRRSIVDLACLTDALETSVSNPSETDPLAVRLTDSAHPDRAAALAREISPWLGDVLSQSAAPHRAVVSRAIVDTLFAWKAVDVRLAAACTTAIAAASEVVPASPWNSWPAAVRTWLGEPFLDELVRARAHDLARRFAEHMASVVSTNERARWLVRAAELTADERAALAVIDAAVRVEPGDDRLLHMQEAALERALAATRDAAERRGLRRRLATLRPEDTVLASKVVDDLLVEGEDDEALRRALELRHRLSHVRDGVDAARVGEEADAAPLDDARLDLTALLDVSSTIARIHVGRGEHGEAFAALSPFFPPHHPAGAPAQAGEAPTNAGTHLATRIPPGVTSLALGIARQLDDPAAMIRVLVSVVATTSGPTGLLMRDELATALERAGETIAAASEWLIAARSSPPAGDDRRRRALRAFQITHGSVDTAKRSQEEEAVALEAALLLLETGAGTLSAEDVTAIATCLWSHERGDQAIAFVGEALRSRPDDDALLTTQRELCAVMARPIDWYDALSQAVATATMSGRRDGLALELAYVGVELEDPARTLAALESINGPLESSPEVLDLRDWAMRRLGRGDDEVRAILDAWASAVSASKDADGSTEAFGVEPDAVLVQSLRRAARILDGDRTALVRRVMDHAVVGNPRISRRLRVTLVRWLVGEDPADFVPTEARVASVLAALRRIADDDPQALRELYEPSRATAADAEADDVTAFLEIARRHDTLQPPPPASLGDAIIASALTRFPESTKVVDAFLALVSADAHRSPRAHGPGEGTRSAEGDRESAAGDPPQTQAAEDVDAELARILPSVGLRPRLTARTWIAVSTRLDRREGSALLLRRAIAWAIDEPEAHDALVDALAERSAWPELVAVLDALASNTAAPAHRRVAAYKRLAHVRLDVLGDDDGVVRELEAALVLAPEDPDLLLPLLDHHYARRDLGPALDLSRRVMAHVPMGDAAFVALGLRTADAALAWGDSKLAESVLDSVLARCPGERRVQARLGELRSETTSPEHRVRMLAAVASRQTGIARRDALEERARLLVSPLGRFDEAITELELLLSDGGLRPELHDLLASLYTQRSRWSELAELLEREYPRKRGLERATILRRLAGVYGDRLYDLPRAEQALRLALENLSSERLTTDVDGRALRDELLFDMVRVLELQGRYGELASMLELELRTDLEGEEAPAPSETPPEGRVRLLEQLARVLRDYVEDEARTARVYERLRQIDRLPDDGLAVLARWYRAERRFDDLVRILELRSAALAASGDLERKAEIDRRIGDLLEGPLRRPRDAARWFLDAYLASPEENASAGAKARVLLAGTDAIENVRKLLLERIEELPPRARPAALTLLGDLLAPQESFEAEAERHYRAALEGDPDASPASEGLGRLLARQGRLEAAAEPLLRAATSDRLPTDRAADVAAIAARVLFELGRITEAERVLKHAVGRAPDAQRALLELARLYSRTRRAEAEADILDRLSELPLSSMLRAEVAYRRAMLLEGDFEREPGGVAGEQAKAWLLEAVGADAMHAQARQTLLGLATARSEWSIVAHMHFLAIRELPPGPSRALAHLDLAEVYLDRLGDAESALRNLGAALTAPTGDLVAERRAHALAMRFPDATRACAHVGRLAVEDGELQPTRRVKLLLVAAELALRGDDPSAAEPFVERALSMEGATEEDREAARRLRASLSREDVELRRQRNALLKLLEAEEHPGERLHILVRLREIGSALSDHDLVTSVTSDLQVLAEAMFDQEGERDAAFLALRELLGERGDYARLVELHERMAEGSTDDVESARILVEAARVAWSGLRDPSRATRLVLRALLAAPDLMEAATLLSELGRSDDATLDALVVDELERIPTHRLGEDLVVRLAMAALRRDREDLAESTLRRALSSTPPERRAPLLDALDALLARRGDGEARMDVLQQRIRHARVHARDRVPDIAFELARAQKAVGAIDAARHTVSEALSLEPTHMELARLEASLLEIAEDWTSLAAALERIAELSTTDDDRAAWITRAAKVHLAHPVGADPGLERVRSLLERARRTSIQAREARALLIPLSFGVGDWPLVLELTVELRAVHGDDEEALIFGALVEALVAGRRTVARAVGARHERNVRMRMMWPAAARLLDVVATEGPLERLDAMLGAIGALVGSTDDALAELSTFAAASPLRAGTALALARLHEAIGRSELARYWYQLVAFLAPLGPVPGLADRLAAPDVPRDPLHVEGWTPLGWRGPLRETLIELRGPFAQMRLQGGTTRPPATSDEVELLRRCDESLQRWRGPLEFDLAVALTDDAVHAGIGARNLLPPTLVVSADFARLPRGEQTFRLAVQAVALASGLGVAVDTHPVDLTDMLDALALLCGVELTPSNPTASSIVDALAARGVRPTSLTPELRRALRDELGHWRSTPTALAQLVATIRRAFLAVALRVSGRLDGALSTLARDLGLVDETGRVDVPATLAAEDAQWLLRELGLLA